MSEQGEGEEGKEYPDTTTRTPEEPVVDQQTEETDATQHTEGETEGYPQLLSCCTAYFLLYHHYKAWIQEE